MTYQWKKIRPIDGLVLDFDKVFIIPVESGGCDIYWGDEFCRVNNINVREFVDKLKTYDSAAVWFTKGSFKSVVENVIKENSQ